MCIRDRAIVDVGLDEAQRRRAGRQEGEDRICAGILDPLHDRAEVGGVERHADRFRHAAALRLEGLAECGFRIDARAVIADRNRDLLRAIGLGDLGRRHRVLPHRERRPHDQRALFDNGRGRCVHHHQRGLGFFQQGRHRHGVGGEIETGEILHLVLDQQLLGQRLGFRRIGRLFIAIDEFDLMIADLGSMLGDPGIDAHLKILAEQGVWTRHGPDHADLDNVRGRGRSHHGQRSHSGYPFHRSLHSVPLRTQAACLNHVVSEHLEIFALLPFGDVRLETLDLRRLDVDVVVHQLRPHGVAEERVLL